MDISRELAIKILKYLDQHPNFYFPFLIMCQEYTPEDDIYQTFQLWENLQDLYEETIELMSKGFIDKITNESLEKHITELAKNYRREWKEKLSESAKIKEYGFNEFIDGKAEAYEDCLEIIINYRV